MNIGGVNNTRASYYQNVTANKSVEKFEIGSATKEATASGDGKVR